MEPRILLPAEANTLMASLACRMATTQEAMVAAADDRDMSKLRARMADYDACEALLRALRAGNFRLMEVRP